MSGKNAIRLDEQGWDNRYDYEAQLICKVAEECNAQTILEIGSGPGILSQKIQVILPHKVVYHLVDKPFAKKYFDENNFKGQFFVKDISIDMDTYGLQPAYDLIIINDTLEHLLAPSNVVKKFIHLWTQHQLCL
jgi:2-polyprenyl-3-methyl-5-hydroxy-6-metoxy-1,4-benzoquinol methylase